MGLASSRKIVFGSILVSGFALPFIWAEGANQSLFVIERSKNANIVQYDACVTADRLLDPKEPVKAYWILLAVEGQHEELSLVERKAYGFDIKQDSSGKSWVMTLAAYRKREITVRQAGTVVRAEMLIAGRPAILEKLYVNSTEGLLRPTVNYIELFGNDLETGARRYEKLIPKAPKQARQTN